jgi:hypothetical protein
VFFVGYVLARLGFNVSATTADLVLGITVAVTTVVSGLTYLVQWARILASSEEAL